MKSDIDNGTVIYFSLLIPCFYDPYVGKSLKNEFFYFFMYNTPLDRPFSCLCKRTFLKCPSKQIEKAFEVKIRTA